MIQDKDGNEIEINISKNDLVFGDISAISHFSAKNVISSGGDSESMIWTITTPSDNFTFRIGGQTGASYNNYDVDWGDGNSETGITTVNKEHTYATAGLYEIKVTGSIYIRNIQTASADAYTEWKQWGTNTQVTGFREWFNGCKNMTYSATDSPNFALIGSLSYTGIYRSFYNTQAITSLDLSGWDVSTLAGIGQQAFSFMKNAVSVNISNWDLSGITTWTNAFQSLGQSTTNGCDFTAPNVNISNATSISQIFINSALKTIDVSNWQLRSAGVNVNQAFRGIGNSSATHFGILNLDVSTWQNTDAINTGNGALLFFQCNGASSINITNWDFRNVTNFSQMFSGANYLTEIVGLQTLRWDSATNLSNCFNDTHRLKFDNYNFDNDFGSAWSVTTMEKCFRNCGKQLAEGSRGVFPNISNWDTSSVTNMAQMFRDSKWNGAGNFTPSSSWDLSNITSLALYLYNVIGIATLDWSNVTLSSSLTNMQQFMSRVTATVSERVLTTVIFGANCDFSGVTTFASAFNSRTTLTRIEFDSSVSFASLTTASNMGTGVPLLTTYYDQLLIRLDATNSLNSGVLTFNLANFTLGGLAETSRTQLITGQSWTITDAGGV